MNQVGDFVLAQGGETVSDPVARWGATLVRATVSAWCNASVADSHILAWAADQDWFVATADDEEAARLAAVGAAACSPATAHPDFVHGMESGKEPPITAARKPSGNNALLCGLHDR